jgi:hypothetical protein
VKKRHLRNCHTCRHNTTTVIDPETGEVRACTPWCQPYQDEWIDDDPEISPDGVITWTRTVGLDDENMPPKRTPVGCPKWAKIKKR